MDDKEKELSELEAMRDLFPEVKRVYTPRPGQKPGERLGNAPTLNPTDSNTPSTDGTVAPEPNGARDNSTSPSQGGAGAYVPGMANRRRVMPVGTPAAASATDAPITGDASGDNGSDDILGDLNDLQAAMPGVNNQGTPAVTPSTSSADILDDLKAAQASLPQVTGTTGFDLDVNNLGKLQEYREYYDKLGEEIAQRITSPERYIDPSTAALIARKGDIESQIVSMNIQEHAVRARIETINKRNEEIQSLITSHQGVIDSSTRLATSTQMQAAGLTEPGQKLAPLINSISFAKEAEDAQARIVTLQEQIERNNGLISEAEASLTEIGTRVTENTAKVAEIDAQVVELNTAYREQKLAEDRNESIVADMASDALQVEIDYIIADPRTEIQSLINEYGTDQITKEQLNERLVALRDKLSWGLEYDENSKENEYANMEVARLALQARAEELRASLANPDTITVDEEVSAHDEHIRSYYTQKSNGLTLELTRHNEDIARHEANVKDNEELRALFTADLEAARARGDKAAIQDCQYQLGVLDGDTFLSKQAIANSAVERDRVQGEIDNYTTLLAAPQKQMVSTVVKDAEKIQRDQEELSRIESTLGAMALKEQLLKSGVYEKLDALIEKTATKKDEAALGVAAVTPEIVRGADAKDPALVLGGMQIGAADKKSDTPSENAGVTSATVDNTDDKKSGLGPVVVIPGLTQAQQTSFDGLTKGLSDEDKEKVKAGVATIVSKDNEEPREVTSVKDSSEELKAKSENRFKRTVTGFLAGLTLATALIGGTLIGHIATDKNAPEVNNNNQNIVVFADHCCHHDRFNIGDMEFDTDPAPEEDDDKEKDQQPGQGGGEETAAPDPVEPDPVVPDPVEPDPVVPDPVVPDPVVPDPVIPDPVIPDPVIPDPVIPDPTIPDPVPPVVEDTALKPNDTIDFGTGTVEITPDGDVVVTGELPDGVTVSDDGTISAPVLPEEQQAELRAEVEEAQDQIIEDLGIDVQNPVPEEYELPVQPEPAPEVNQTPEDAAIDDYLSMFAGDQDPYAGVDPNGVNVVDESRGLGK